MSKLVKRVLLVAAVLIGVPALLLAITWETSAFELIYLTNYWGTNDAGEGTSGGGSTEEVTREYRLFLERLIREENITSVVDGGCGDWEFSQFVDWGGADYLGIDISHVAIQRVQERFSGPKVRFEQGSVIDPLPPADLLIVKDVLMHLPIEDIHTFIENNLQPGRYKIALLTHNRSEDPSKNNGDIPHGLFRRIDLRSEPFNVRGLEDHFLFDSEPDKVTQVLRLN